MEKLFKERGLNYGIGNSGFISNPEKENYGYSPDGIIYNRDNDELVGLAEYKSVDKVIHGGDAWNKKYMAMCSWKISFSMGFSFLFFTFSTHC